MLKGLDPTEEPVGHAALLRFSVRGAYEDSGKLREHFGRKCTKLIAAKPRKGGKKSGIDPNTIASDTMASIVKDANQSAAKDIWPALSALVETADTACQQLSLSFALVHIARMRDRFNSDASFEFADLQVAFKELAQRIEDQIRDQSFIYVDPKRAEYFTEDGLFGPVVADKL